MHNQLKLEMYKIKRSKIFYLGILAFIALGILIGVKAINLHMVSGKEIFLDTVSDTSVMFLLSLFICYFIGDDFTNRTIDNEIRVGYSRLSVILARGIVVLPFTVLIYMCYTITTTVCVGIINGFGTEVTIIEMLVRLILFAFQVMAVQSFTIFFIFVCKNATLGMVVSVCFTFVTCNLLRNFMGEENFLFRITSFYRIMMNSESLTIQNIIVSFVSAIVTIIIMFFITHMAFRKADLQ